MDLIDPSQYPENKNRVTGKGRRIVLEGAELDKLLQFLYDTQNSLQRIRLEVLEKITREPY